MKSRYAQIFREGYSYGWNNCLAVSNRLYATKRSEEESILVSLLFQFSADVGGLVRDLKKASEACKARREARKSKGDKS